MVAALIVGGVVIIAACVLAAYAYGKIKAKSKK
jgi:hypothetical protein